MFPPGDTAQAVTLILAAIVLVVLLNLGILGAILALVAGSLARPIVFSYLLRRHENIKWALQLSSYAEFHEAVKFGMPIVANQVSTWGRQMGQRVVLLHVVPAAQVGVFFLAGSIANMLLVIVQAVSAVFDPLYYKRRVEDAEGFRQKVQIFTQIYFAILAMIVIPCILFVDEINHLLFKNKYENLGPAAAILLAASYARLQQPFISKQLLFQKKTLWIPLATLGPSLIALALTPVVAPQGGLAAVSWLAVAAVVASLVGLGTAVRRYEELDFPTGTAAALLFLVCLSAFWISIGAPGPDGHPVKILMKAVLAIAIVGICAFVWLWKNRSFLRTIARG